jgi:hypothetical protein
MCTTQSHTCACAERKETLHTKSTWAFCAWTGSWALWEEHTARVRDLLMLGFWGGWWVHGVCYIAIQVCYAQRLGMPCKAVATEHQVQSTYLPFPEVSWELGLGIAMNLPRGRNPREEGALVQSTETMRATLCVRHLFKSSLWLKGVVNTWDREGLLQSPLQVQRGYWECSSPYLSKGGPHRTLVDQRVFPFPRAVTKRCENHEVEDGAQVEVGSRGLPHQVPELPLGEDQGGQVVCRAEPPAYLT